MKTKGFVILQAYKKKYEGIKSLNCPIAGLFFFDEEEARNYLEKIVIERKKEMRLGIRDEFNIHPELGLDFAIVPCEVEIDITKVNKKGWQI